jgi:2-oxoacid:acceptor oxidoreductase delta subunit (pyruvate/2-ketoisovalerate family)
MENKIYTTLLKSSELPLGGLIDECGTSVHRKTGDWSTVKPIRNEKCINCFMCWSMCPDTAIPVINGKVTGFDYDHCKGCGVCAAVCPAKIKAISMVDEAEIKVGKVVTK